MKDRKKDHIDMTSQARVRPEELDNRYYYEPLLSGHPLPDKDISVEFLGKRMEAPIWISSMTGGTGEAGKINRNLARATAEFGLGMGLGSCRVLLENPDYFPDFDLRPILGKDRPFYANLGIAQVEQLLERKEEERIYEMLNKLQADGLIIHVNPLQEWMQPEGDRIKRAPEESIAEILEKGDLKLIVKEVGQGMGIESLRRLMQMPLQAIEFGAAGGTNFTKMEALRQGGQMQNHFHRAFIRIGHDAGEMTDFVNRILREEQGSICRSFIVSGGVKDYLDGYYFIQKIKASAVYGIASAALHYAKEDYEKLRTYFEAQIRGLQMASAYLRVKNTGKDA